MVVGTLLTDGPLKSIPPHTTPPTHPSKTTHTQTTGVFTRIRPYGAGYLTNFSLGREVLVMAGNAVFTGVQNIVYTLFSSYPYMSGKVLCVLGGTATMIGGYSVYASGGQMALGWGIDLAARAYTPAWVEEDDCGRAICLTI